METAYHASTIFNGVEFLADQVIVVDGGVIKNVLPLVEWKGESKPLNGTVYPGFIDLQVYGAAGKLLAMYPSPGTLSLMEKVFILQGTFLFQPTVATNSNEVFRASIDAVRDYKTGGGKAVHGLHIEGPWINPGKKGAHLEEYIHSPKAEEVRELLEYGKGIITMITLAPEMVSPEIIELVSSYNVCISAGHSNADFTHSTESFNSGITAATHLFNAMSSLHHRAPGLPGAVLLHNNVCASIIPDGIHVSYETVSIAKKIMGERLFVITDAVTETTEGPYRHHLTGDYYECNGTLSGSALSMHQAFRNLISHCNIDTGEAHRMCSLYPARVVGLQNTYGHIAPGYTAKFITMDDSLDPVDVIN
jgi:N-acetylglucosamine-6-phosphate deacetylase